MQRISITVSDKMKQQLIRMRNERIMSVSDVIRECIRKEVSEAK